VDVISKKALFSSKNKLKDDLAEGFAQFSKPVNKINVIKINTMLQNNVK